MTKLSWARAGDLGAIGVPAGSHWQLGGLAEEVKEYFDNGVEVARGDVVFDVGANIGAFAIAAARRAGEIQLHAFEPVPPLFDALSANAKKNTALSKSTCNLAAVAVGDGVGPSTVEVSYFTRLPTDSTMDLEGKRRDWEIFFEHHGERVRRRLGRFLPSRVADAAGRAFASLAVGRSGRWFGDRIAGRVQFSCPIVTLSDVIDERRVERIDVLKIDVEGAELRVLEGISEAHWPLVKQVVLEGHDHDGRKEEILGLLRAAGFGTFNVSQPASVEHTGLNSFLIYASR